MTIVIDTPEGINRYVVVTLRSGLKMYRDTGIKPNRMWSPKNMMLKASQLTGKSYKRSDYTAAINDLTALLEKDND